MVSLCATVIECEVVPECVIMSETEYCGYNCVKGNQRSHDIVSYIEGPCKVYTICTVCVCHIQADTKIGPDIRNTECVFIKTNITSNAA